MRCAAFIALFSMTVLAACSSGERRPLNDLRTFSGEPEEFAIVPNKPLQTPDTVSDLPPPTPGGVNRTDQTPLADAVAALGGNPAAVRAGGIPAGDSALVAQASRFGRDAGIRQALSQEDEQFRRARGRFSWQLINNDRYQRVYRGQALDPYAWTDRYRRAGASTPSAPPAR